MPYILKHVGLFLLEKLAFHTLETLLHHFERAVGIIKLYSIMEQLNFIHHQLKTIYEEKFYASQQI